MAETPQGPIGQQGPVDKKAGDPKATRQKLSTSAASCGSSRESTGLTSTYVRENVVLANL